MRPFINTVQKKRTRALPIDKHSRSKSQCSQPIWRTVNELFSNERNRPLNFRVFITAPRARARAQGWQTDSILRAEGGLFPPIRFRTRTLISMLGTRRANARDLAIRDIRSASESEAKTMKRSRGGHARAEIRDVSLRYCVSRIY